MNKRQAFREFVRLAPDLTWQERATLRFVAIFRWDEVETLLNSAAAEKAGVADVAALEAPGAPTIDWLALLMELLPIILKYFFNK